LAAQELPRERHDHQREPNDTEKQDLQSGYDVDGKCSGLQARNVPEEWRRLLKRAHSSRNTATVAMRNVINVHIQGHDSVA